MKQQDHLRMRHRMVEKQIYSRHIHDPRILDAMRRVERHFFVSEEYCYLAYKDRPLPIGHGQTISQPYIVALMTELCQIKPEARILEIGTGCGYQTAILAELSAKVYTIETIPQLAQKAKRSLKHLGYRNISFRTGNGLLGWPQEAPFDAILAAAAAERVPQSLCAQLKPGASLVIPLGKTHQELLSIRRTEWGFERKSIIPVRFVPMK